MGQAVPMDDLPGAAVPASDLPTEEGNYMVEAARKGLSGFLGTAAGFAGGLSSVLSGKGDIRAVNAFLEQHKRVKEASMDILGSTGAKPKDLGEKIISTGIETATDPLSYMLPAGGAVSKLPSMMRPAYRIAENFLSGAGAEAGGTAGEYVGKKIGGETGATIGRVGGALTGGVGGSLVASATPRTINAVGSVSEIIAPKVKELWGGISGKTALGEVERQASRHIENVFVAAASSDPNFLKILEEAAIAQKATGVKLPLSAVLADNKVISAYIGNIAAKDQAFRNQYYAQFEAAKDALRGKSTRLFGDPSKANEVLSGSISDIDIAGAVARRVSGIEKQAKGASKGIQTIDPAEFGAKVVQVTDDAEKAAINSTRPMYKEAFKTAEVNGVHLPEDAVADIHGFVTGEKVGDIFKTFPSIYNKIQSRFRPQTVEGAGLVSATGAPIGKQTESVFKSATLEDLDSLKREVNNQLRKTKTDSEIRILSELKTKVNQHIDNLDPEFVAKYRAADAAYLERVGLPFNEETIKMIGRAKFDENVIPLLTRNKSTLSQFIDATGKPGEALAEQAFISDLANFAIKDGVLSPARANAWLKNKGDALSMLPDVRERVTAAAGNVQELLNQKSALGAKFVKQAEDKILKLEGKSAQDIVGSMYGSTGFTEKFMRQHGTNQDSLTAVRSFLLDDIISAPNPINVLNDRSKSAVFNRVFGPTYSEKVKQLSVIADRITHDPSAVHPSISAISRTSVESLVGTSPTSIVSKISNPVMSKEIALFSLVSRFINRKASDAVDRDMKRILLDPAEAALLFKSVQPRVDKIDYEKLQRDVTALAKKTGLDFKDMLIQDMKAGALRSSKGMDMEPQQEEETQ